MTKAKPNENMKSPEGVAGHWVSGVLFLIEYSKIFLFKFTSFILNC